MVLNSNGLKYYLDCERRRLHSCYDFNLAACGRRLWGPAGVPRGTDRRLSVREEGGAQSRTGGGSLSARGGEWGPVGGVP